MRAARFASHYEGDDSDVDVRSTLCLVVCRRMTLTLDDVYDSLNNNRVRETRRDDVSDLARVGSTTKQLRKSWVDKIAQESREVFARSSKKIT